MPNPTATTANPALLPSPALFDVTTIAAKDVEGTIERVALDQLELAANARRDISEEGIERLAAMLMRTGQLVPCIGHRAAAAAPVLLYDGQRRLLAEEWAKFCAEAKADPAVAEGGRKVVALRRRRAKAA